MTLQLINGQFTAPEAIEIITQLIHVKIKFHENKMARGISEEDAKSREAKIKSLQKQLFDARNLIGKNAENVNIDCKIQL